MARLGTDAHVHCGEGAVGEEAGLEDRVGMAEFPAHEPTPRDDRRTADDSGQEACRSGWRR